MTSTLVPTGLWTQAGCGPCIAAERMLKDAGVNFVKIDAKHADTARVARWRALNPGKRIGTPIIESGGLVIIGADPDRIAALA